MESFNFVARLGLGLIFIGGLITFIWQCILFGIGNRIDSTTEEMVKTPVRKWTLKQRQEGSESTAMDFKLWRPLVRPARWMLVVGVVLAILGLVLEI